MAFTVAKLLYIGQYITTYADYNTCFIFISFFMEFNAYEKKILIQLNCTEIIRICKKSHLTMTKQFL